MNYIYSPRDIGPKEVNRGTKGRIGSRCLLMRLTVFAYAAISKHLALLDIVSIRDKIPATFHFRLPLHRMSEKLADSEESKQVSIARVDAFSINIVTK